MSIYRELVIFYKDCTRVFWIFINVNCDNEERSGLGKCRFHSNVNVANRLIGFNALITSDMVSLCPELPLPNQVSRYCLFCIWCKPQC